MGTFPAQLPAFPLPNSKWLPYSLVDTEQDWHSIKQSNHWRSSLAKPCVHQANSLYQSIYITDPKLVENHKKVTSIPTSLLPPPLSICQVCEVLIKVGPVVCMTIFCSLQWKTLQLSILNCPRKLHLVVMQLTRWRLLENKTKKKKKEKNPYQKGSSKH